MNILDQIMGVKEAGELWGLSPDRVKGLCQNGDVEARKIGNSWVLLKSQPNPKRRKKVMKKVIIERIKKHDHIIGSEYKHEYGGLQPSEFMDEIYCDMDGEQIEANKEELDAIQELKDGNHCIDQGDFEVFVTISDMAQEISDLVDNMDF